MRRELYIGGRLADIDNTAVPLNFACSEIADLSGVSGNYSLTVKLPLTGNNIMIGYFANLPNTSPAALWTGYKTTASYFINGVPIFQDATAKLLSVEKTIDIQITFGNLMWLDVLETYKLKDYVSIGQIHDWNYWAIENETTEVRWVLAEYGGTFANGLHMEKMFPCVNAIRIWNNLFSRMIVNGVIDGGGSSVFMDYDLWLPLTNVYHNPELPVGESFSLPASLELSDVADPIRSTDGMSSFANTPSHPGMVFTNVKGFFIVPVNGNYRIRMGSSFYVVVSSGQYDTITASFDLKYRADDSVAVNLFTHYSVDGVSNESYPIDFDEVVTLKKGDVLYLELNVSQSGLPGYSVYTELTDSANIFSIEYVAEANKKVRSEFFMPIDIDYNLPDITCKDFVKAVMQFYGLLVENKDDGIDKTVKFFNLDTLKSDRIPDGNIVDWSDKLVSFDRPKIEWNLGLKERNYLRYTEDDTDNVFEDAYFTSYETDNGEKDIFKSLFAASDDVTLTGTSYTPVPICSVPVWVIDEKTNEWKFEGKARQRIFRGYLNTEDTFDLEVVQLYSEGYDPIMITQADVYVSYFKDVPAQIAETNYGLDMSSIIARNYTGFIDAVKSNRLFTFQFLLNEIDINRFTHITPVWIEKFSNFFFVKKINNWEAGRVCSVEMLQLYDSGAIGTRISGGLELTFDDILNVPVADASSVSDWNTFFDLPTNGTPFTSVVVDGDKVTLIGGANIHLKDELFYLGSYTYNETLLSVKDTNSVISAGNKCFNYCNRLTRLEFPVMTTAGEYTFQLVDWSNTNVCILVFPELTEIGTYCFAECLSVAEFNFPKLTTSASYGFAYNTSAVSFNFPLLSPLGGSSGDDGFFTDITFRTITLTVPASAMTCNGGNPDGDIEYLQSFNTVTIVTV